jgi:hypothetical protein
LNTQKERGYAFLRKNRHPADTNWPDWYAEYMVREQAGDELPQ